MMPLRGLNVGPWADHGIQCRKEYKIDHFQQQDTWDCGLTCVMMILSPKLKQYFVDNLHEICTEGGFGRSTWTIDLSYILKKFNIHHVYLTKTIGIDPDYYKHSYYNKILLKDEKRILAKLNQAESHGITIDQKSVSFESLLVHLSSHGPIIILTNSGFLYCDICRKEKRRKKEQYSGHYVVLCGYDLLRKQIFYKNPARNNHMCITSFDNMNEARTAFGTDEDILLIFDCPWLYI